MLCFAGEALLVGLLFPWPLLYQFWFLLHFIETGGKEEELVKVLEGGCRQDGEHSEAPLPASSSQHDHPEQAPPHKSLLFPLPQHLRFLPKWHTLLIMWEENSFCGRKLLELVTLCTLEEVLWRLRWSLGQTLNWPQRFHNFKSDKCSKKLTLCFIKASWKVYGLASEWGFFFPCNYISLLPLNTVCHLYNICRENECFIGHLVCGIINTAK